MHACVVAERRPERLQHPRSAVGGRAAAQSQHDPRGARVERGHQELARSVRRGNGRCLRRGTRVREQVQAGGLGQLDDGRRPLGGEDCLHRLTERPPDRDAAGTEPARDGGLDGPLASIGHGAGHHSQVRLRVGDARGQGEGHLASRERPLELVGGDEHDPARVRGHRSREGLDDGSSSPVERGQVPRAVERVTQQWPAEADGDRSPLEVGGDLVEPDTARGHQGHVGQRGPDLAEVLQASDRADRRDLHRRHAGLPGLEDLRRSQRSGKERHGQLVGGLDEGPAEDLADEEVGSGRHRVVHLRGRPHRAHPEDQVIGKGPSDLFDGIQRTFGGEGELQAAKARLVEHLGRGREATGIRRPQDRDDRPGRETGQQGGRRFVRRGHQALRSTRVCARSS